MTSLTVFAASFGIFSLWSEIINYAAWAFFAGLVVSLGFVALLFVIIRGFYPKSTFSPGSWIAGGVLAVLLLVQLTPMFAAFSLKGTLSDLENWMNASLLHNVAGAMPLPLTEEETNEIVERTAAEYPVFGQLVDYGGGVGYDTSNFAHALVGELNSYLNKLIWKLLIIALIETAICAFIIIKLLEVRGKGRGAMRPARAGSRGSSTRSARPRGRTRIRAAR